MKQLCFLGILVTCFVLFTSTLLNAVLIERTFTVVNKSENEVRVAYCCGIKEEDVNEGEPGGYYIQGWEYVNPGYKEEFKVDTSYPSFFVYIQGADGTEYGVKRGPSKFYVQPEEENFLVIQRSGDGKILHHTGNQSSLQTRSFYRYADKTILPIPGPLAIQDDDRFYLNYDTRGFSRQGTDYALLFATNEYTHWSNLRTPIADVEAIGAELQNRYGFKVDIRRNVTKKQILDALSEYKVKKYAPGDQLFIYFAGHGEYDATLEDGHVAGTESELPEVDKNLTTYLSFGKLRGDLEKFPCERIMLTLDVCHGGTFDETHHLKDKPAMREKPRTRGAQPLTSAELLNLIKPEITLAVKTRWYLSSGGDEKVSDGFIHSPFALALLTLLRNRDKDNRDDGILTIPEIERQLGPTLDNELKKVNFKQTPASGAFGSGRPADKAFLFIDRTHTQRQQSGFTTN